MGMGTRDEGQGMGSGTRTHRLTFKDLWRVKLVRIARFRDRDFGADLEEGRTGGHVADATRHDHQELRMERETLGRMQRASVDRESEPSFGDREEQGRRKKGDVSSFHHSCSDRGGRSSLVLTRCISSWSWVMRSICDNSCSIALLDRDAFFFLGQKVGDASHSPVNVRMK